MTMARSKVMEEVTQRLLAEERNAFVNNWPDCPHRTGQDLCADDAWAAALMLAKCDVHKGASISVADHAWALYVESVGSYGPIDGEDFAGVYECQVENLHQAAGVS